MIYLLTKGTAEGPSGLWVQHLLDVTAIPLHTPICTSLRSLVNILAGGRDPPSISKFLAGGRLITLSKTTEASKSDIRPIVVGETLRRLMAKCLCLTIREKARDLFQPLQVEVACSERIIHGLRNCIDDHWDDDDFVVFKVDMRNAFNIWYQDRLSWMNVLPFSLKSYPGLSGVTGLTLSSGILEVNYALNWVCSRETPWDLCCSPLSCRNWQLVSTLMMSA